MANVQVRFCSLLFDTEALTSISATIKANNLLCGGYPCCKRSAMASR